MTLSISLMTNILFVFSVSYQSTTGSKDDLILHTQWKDDKIEGHNINDFPNAAQLVNHSPVRF